MKQDSNMMKLQKNNKETLKITPDSWVLSLVRKADNEHGFIIVEGIMKYESIVRRYDLFTNGNKNSNRPAQKTVEIHIPEKYGNDEVSEFFTKDLYKGYGEDEEKPEIHSISWSITEDKARELHKIVENDQKKAENFEMSYFLSGGKSIFGLSSQPSENNHNCYSWAKKKIEELNIRGVKIPTKVEDYFIMVPSRHIGPKDEKMLFSDMVNEQSGSRER